MKDRVKETVLDLLEEICGDDVVREDMDVNLLEEDLIDSLDYTCLLYTSDHSCSRPYPWFNMYRSPRQQSRIYGRYHLRYGSRKDRP